MLDVVYEPVSLGFDCETKFQIARALNTRLYPDRSPMAFRYAVRRPEYAAPIFGWRMFDWQTTPLATVCEYLERDFEGVFELEDLELTDEGVRNVRFDTLHVHEFAPTPEIRIPMSEIGEKYEFFRAHFDCLADDFRALLKRPGPYLYVLGYQGCPDLAIMRRLVAALSRNPQHCFHILVMSREGYDTDLSSLGDVVTKTWQPLDPQKPQKIAWEGHDASWDKALAPFNLTIRDVDFNDPTLAWAGISMEGGPQPARGRRQRSSPPPASVLAWDGGPDTVFSYKFWRDLGAVLERTERGAFLRTPPIAWHYGQNVKLDFSQVDFDHQHAWVRLKLADVQGALYAAMFDPVANVVFEEALVSEGPGPFTLYFRIADASQSQLIFRSGPNDAAGEGLVLDVQVLTADA